MTPTQARLRTLTVAASAWLALLGCKPDNEPPRRLPASPVVDRGDGPLGPGPLDPPLDEADAAGVVAAEDVEAEPSVSPEEARLALLRAPPSPEAERAARQATDTARKLHRKLDVRAAVAEYQRALEAWPGCPEALYGLAGALALLGDADGAVARLEDLTRLDTEGARALLDAARFDPDFEAVAARPAFRGLTGYLPVTVAWAESGVDRSLAQARVAALREARVPAALGAVWSEAIERTVVLFRADVDGAEALAEAARRALGAAEMQARGDLDPATPVVAVLAPERADAAPGDAVAAAPTLESFVGPRLRATVDGAVEELQLKGTGFFSWERTEDGGKRIKRTGRYLLHAEGKLHIDFRQTTEVPGDDPLAPDVSVEQGRRSTHAVAATPSGLKVDGVVFEVVP